MLTQRRGQLSVPVVRCARELGAHAGALYEDFAARRLRSPEQLRGSSCPAPTGALHVFATRAACGCRLPPGWCGAQPRAASRCSLSCGEPDAPPPRARGPAHVHGAPTSDCLLSGGPRHRSCAVRLSGYRRVDQPIFTTGCVHVLVCLESACYVGRRPLPKFSRHARMCTRAANKTHGRVGQGPQRQRLLHLPIKGSMC